MGKTSEFEGLQEILASAGLRGGAVDANFMGNLREGMQKMLEDPDEMMAFMEPPELSSSALKECRKLPQSNQVWLVSLTRDHDEDGTFLQAMVTIVEKEKAKGTWEDGDGLSLTLSQTATVVPLNSLNSYDDNRVMVGAILRACQSPGVNSPIGPSISTFKNWKAVRPMRVLFPSAGASTQASSEMKKMGIPEWGPADSSLLQAMSTSAVNNPKHDPSTLLNMMNNNSDPQAFGKAMARSVEAITDGPYLDENRRPLGSWSMSQMPGEWHLPEEWFAYPPSRKQQKSEFNPAKFWGWRTNLETACKIGDGDKIRELCRTYGVENVRTTCEMRLHLTKYAQNGLVDTCRVLLEDVKVAPDGVRASSNRPEWRKAQEDSGDNNNAAGTTPLLRASQAGQAAVVKVLLEFGANPDIRDFKANGTALHFACNNAHLDVVKYLCDAGVDRELRGSDGSTPLGLARVYNRFKTRSVTCPL